MSVRAVARGIMRSGAIRPAAALLALLGCFAVEKASRCRGRPSGELRPHGARRAVSRGEPAKQQLSNVVAYIPPQCFTKTPAVGAEPAKNPCYVCHASFAAPNFNDDGNLQLSLLLPVGRRSKTRGPTSSRPPS